VFTTTGCSEGLQGVLFCCFAAATLEGKDDGSGSIMAHMYKNINAMLRVPDD
jgi:hypothetical protein